MFLANPFTGAFGIDIGDLSLKLVQLRKQQPIFGRPPLALTAVRTVELPPGIIVNGEIQQPELARRKLLYLLGADGRQRPIGSTWVVADLPEPQTFLKLITIETLAEELTDEDIRYHAKKHLPFELEGAYLDWQVIAPDSAFPNSQVLIGAVSKVIADSYTYLLESVGLNVLALENEGLAVARSLITRRKDYQGEARAILDFGATRTSLLVYDHNTIQFSAIFHFSGELINTALTQELKLEYGAAEELKIKSGLSHAPEHPKYLKIISGLVEGLIAELQRTLEFYTTHFAGANPVTHLTMSGGLARLKNLNTTLASKLKISAEPGNAWKNLTAGVAASPAERERGLALVSAIGLALRAVEHPLPLD